MKKRSLLLTPLILFVLGAFIGSQIDVNAQSTSCATPPTDTGKVTLSTDTTAGTYRIWSRMKAANSSDNSFLIQIDSECPILVGDSSSISSADWTWVDYQNGSSANKIDVNLTSGNHVITLIGKENNVSVDKVLLTQILSCIPTGFGDNCPAVADITPPVISAVSASNITDTSVKITWTLDEPSTGQIEYGTTTSYGSFSTKETSFKYTTHIQTISGLSPGTTYNYRIISEDQAGNRKVSGNFKFTTTGGSAPTAINTPAPTLTTGPAGGTGTIEAFIESGGSVTMEGENFDSKTTNGSTYRWATITNNLTFDNRKITFISARPNDDKKTYFAGGHVNGPEVTYNINFTKTGTYWVYVRSSGPDAKSDSAHVGLDGNLAGSMALYYKGEGGKTSIWQWEKKNNDGTRAKINVTTPGIHKFHIWMREDGTRIDRIRLLQNKGWTPSSGTSAIGPNENSRGTFSPPTITIPPIQTALNFATVKLHGIGIGGDNENPNGSGNNNPITTTRPIKVELFDLNENLVTSAQGNITYSPNTRYFSGNINIDNVTSGNYIVKITTDKYLIRQLPGIINIIQGQVNKMPNVTLVTGDVNGDKSLSILDYNVLIGCFSDELPAQNCNPTDKFNSDLSDDDNVNLDDLSLFLREFRVVTGD